MLNIKKQSKKTFGGILGENSNFSQIKNSYYDRMTSGYDAAVLAGKTWISYSGTAFTTDQTKLNDSSVVYDVAIYIDWDFVDETAKGSSANQVIFDPSGDLYVNGSCNYGSPGTHGYWKNGVWNSFNVGYAAGTISFDSSGNLYAPFYNLTKILLLKMIQCLPWIIPMGQI